MRCHHCLRARNSPDDARAVVRTLLDALEAGSVRAAEKDQTSGVWRAVPWVKRGILLGFRVGGMIDMSISGTNDVGLAFFDKDTYPPRRLTLQDGIRIVPGGSSIRRGAYVAAGVVCMPPMYVNVGAHVGAGTMIDSHALVGSCAQVGERVHLSAAAQLGRCPRAGQRRPGRDRGRCRGRRQLRDLRRHSGQKAGGDRRRRGSDAGNAGLRPREGMRSSRRNLVNRSRSRRTRSSCRAPAPPRAAGLANRAFRFRLRSS